MTPKPFGRRLTMDTGSGVRCVSVIKIALGRFNSLDTMGLLFFSS
jgi:hypothetical protein